MKWNIVFKSVLFRCHAIFALMNVTCTFGFSAEQMKSLKKWGTEDNQENCKWFRLCIVYIYNQNIV